MGNLHLWTKCGKGHVKLLLHAGALGVGILKKFYTLWGNGLDRFTGDILTEELGDVQGEHLKELVIAAEFLLLTDGLIELVAPGLACHLATKVHDPGRPMELGALIELDKDPRHGRGGQMLGHSMDVVEPLDIHMIRTLHSCPILHLADVRQTTARDVAGFTGCHTSAIAPLVLVKVGIVDSLPQDLT